MLFKERYISMQIKNGIIDFNAIRFDCENQNVILNLTFQNGKSAFQAFHINLMKENSILIIKRILMIFDVESLSCLIGKPVRLKVKNELIIDFGHFLDDEWVLNEK